MEDINARIDNIRSVLSDTPVDPKVLSGVLSGSIMLRKVFFYLPVCQKKPHFFFFQFQSEVSSLKLIFYILWHMLGIYIFIICTHIYIYALQRYMVEHWRYAKLFSTRKYGINLILFSWRT